MFLGSIQLIEVSYGTIEESKAMVIAHIQQARADNYLGPTPDAVSNEFRAVIEQRPW